MTATDREWAAAYAKQALSDLNAREALVYSGSKQCHRLHFLQMAAEKACKAFLTMGNGHETVRKSHAYVARNLPIIARHFYPVLNDNNRIPGWELDQIRQMSREIEALAPACDVGSVREDNCEYPWENENGEVSVPCEYSFPKINDGDRSIVRLIRLLRTACESYTG